MRSRRLDARRHQRTIGIDRRASRHNPEVIAEISNIHSSVLSAFGSSKKPNIGRYGNVYSRFSSNADLGRFPASQSTCGHSWAVNERINPEELARTPAA